MILEQLSAFSCQFSVKNRLFFVALLLVSNLCNKMRVYADPARLAFDLTERL